ncbi:MAG: alpha/beta hydrolase [Candidatus Kariarchaeaceae archaeon]|jgi:carboxylesterase
MIVVKYIIYVCKILIQPFINLYEALFPGNINTEVDKKKGKFVSTPKNELKNKTGIFLIHGIGAHPRVFDKYLKPFEKEDFYICGALLPGHFTSSADLARVRRTAWTKSILDQYDIFAKQVDNIIIVGHSLGAILALDVAIKRKNSGLVLLATPIIPKSILFKYLKSLIPILIYTFKYYVFPPKKVQHYEKLGVEVYYKHPFRTFDEMFKLASEIEPNLNQISNPTLLIMGDNDELVDRKTHDLIREKINTGLVQEWIAPDATHSIVDTSDIDGFNKQLQEFIMTQCLPNN